MSRVRVPSLLSASNMTRVAGVVVGGALAVLYGVYRFAPGVVVNAIASHRVRKARLKRKSLRAADFDWQYLEGGEEHEQTIVFTHGYTSAKEDFGPCDILGTLTNRYHVLLPDLPGHGETTPLDINRDYSVESQVNNVEHFLKAAFAKSGKSPSQPFHLAGHSMGGAIAGVYAATHPSRVKTLFLACPLGVRGDQMSGMEKDEAKRRERGESHLLVPETFEQMKEMFTKVSAVPQRIPEHFLRHLFNLRLKRRDLHVKIGDDLRKHYLHLHEVLESIRAPTLVLWGDKDYILDVSGANVIRKYIPTYTDVVIYEGKGHNLLFEALSEVTKAYTDFLEKYSSVAVVANDVL